MFDPKAGSFAVGEPISTLPPDFVGRNTAAEIALGLVGSVLYASNRGHDSIAWFGVDRASGELSKPRFVPCGGRKPRHFAIDPTGRFLIVANQGSDSLVVFSIDPATGEPAPVGRPFHVPGPTCVRMRLAEGPRA